jgi:hypothetical protein
MMSKENVSSDRTFADQHQSNPFWILYKAQEQTSPRSYCTVQHLNMISQMMKYQTKEVLTMPLNRMNTSMLQDPIH